MTNHPKKANSFAVAGFPAPFVAAGVVCVLLLITGDEFNSSKVFIIYQIAIPRILITGIVLGIKSIPGDGGRGGGHLDLLTSRQYCLHIPHRPGESSFFRFLE